MKTFFKIVVGVIVLFIVGILIVAITELIPSESFDWIIIVIFAFFVILFIIDKLRKNSSGDTSKTQSEKSKSSHITPSATGKRGAVLDMNGKVITSFLNGIVYFENSNSILGKYDNNGRVFNKEGNYIGCIIGDSCVMDRTYNYEWLRKTLTTEDLATHDPRFKPAMTMEAGIDYVTCIETPFDEKRVALIHPNSDPIGPGAAFLIAINDILLLKSYYEFYKTSNVQQDCYYIYKNGRGTAYADYFRQHYGQPWWSLD